MPPPVHSPLQKQVLALYRRALRSIRTKPPSSRPTFRSLYRYTFRTRATQVSKRDIGAVEYLLRQGRRWVEGLEKGSVGRVELGEEGREWVERWREGGRGRDYWIAREAAHVNNGENATAGTGGAGGA